MTSVSSVAETLMGSDTAVVSRSSDAYGSPLRGPQDSEAFQSFEVAEVYLPVPTLRCVLF